MHSRRIQLADAMDIEECMCLAIENGEECLNYPRWIEDDWQKEHLDLLKRAHKILELRSDRCSRALRSISSTVIIVGQVCQHHSRHFARRLHTLLMIRGDVNSDMREPPVSVRGDTVRTAVARAARKRAVRSAKCLTPDQGRAGREGLRNELESIPSSPTDHSVSSTTPPSLDTSEQKSNQHALQRNLNHVGERSTPPPDTPQPASHQTSLERLMLLGHLQESEDRFRHLEHDAYVSKDQIAGLRHWNAELKEWNRQLKLERVRQAEELTQAQNLLRSAGEQFLGFLAANNR